MIPRSFAKVGEAVLLTGTAYDFGHAISAIEFSLDEGKHWTRYETPETNDYQNLTWSFGYTPTAPGFFVLYVRSVNDAGEHSPESACVELVVEE